MFAFSSSRRRGNVVTPRAGRARAAIALAAVALTAAAGCSAGGSSSGADDTLVVNTSFVYKTLDPARAYEQTGYLSVHSLYSTLLTFEGADITTPVPDLAESFEANADNTAFTFTLRDNAVFSDGSPVTSEDVLFSLDRMLNIKGSASGFFAGLTFAAPDERTVTITSEIPRPTLVTLLAMPAASIVNSEVAQANGASAAPDAATADTAQSFLDSESAGSGPYIVDRNDPGNEIVLTANENYWGEKPEFTRVVIRNTDIQNQKLTMTRSTSPELSLDLTGNLLDGLPESLTVSELQDTMYYAYANTNPAVSEITSNPAFATAFKAALDYEGIAGLYGRGGDTLGGFIAPAYPGSLPKEDGPVQDLALATRLIDEAGLAGRPVEYIYPAITYRGVDLGTVATKIQGDVAKAGIELQLTPLPLAAFLERNRAGQAPMGMSPQALTYPRAENLVQLMKPGGVNSARAGWTDANASPAAIAAAKTFLDDYTDEGRTAAVQDWQRVMATDSPFIPLAVNSGCVVSTSAVTGAEYTPAAWIVDLASVKAA
ncbi:ABC transporter substrate-binding protein [Rhodococcus sp. IEGM 1381]|uniref:ABC transporter substrate-binding protein n=1 Tax=Rhodococcus sp. IEGM 1381 TaxID=3047085 RepID=UPI0024B80AD0|nr:ABC transporter substrate-binding protein [Rhodococcus sp. IEGM 1381]MDI9896878.1 ABC transporter substrate-binding protein [Rhodococcus sp. IEGM 1381]